VKIGYSGNEITLMIPAIQLVYDYSYVTLDDIKYYLTNNIVSNLYTYEQDFEGANNPFNLGFNETLNLPNERKSRQLAFEYKGQKHNIAVPYNQNMVDFYNSYPPLDIGHYFNTPVSTQTASSLQEQFDNIISEHSEEEKANILLTFIHQAFPYKTDDDQFGREKYFYVEDIFSWSHCDCEDRSVLYSYLIKNLVGLDVIGINAPGHVFTAVEFKRLFGDYIEYNNKNLIICDPTYIGAEIGRVMPDMLDKELIIIPTDLNNKP
jgi:hypothetical protein